VAVPYRPARNPIGRKRPTEVPAATRKDQRIPHLLIDHYVLFLPFNGAPRRYVSGTLHGALGASRHGGGAGHVIGPLASYSFTLLLFPNRVAENRDGRTAASRSHTHIELMIRCARARGISSCCCCSCEVGWPVAIEPLIHCAGSPACRARRKRPRQAQERTSPAVLCRESHLVLPRVDDFSKGEGFALAVSTLRTSAP
jgi:hypothetical protein